jgi:predicted enzyme related to lactoylglutathione lyase
MANQVAWFEVVGRDGARLREFYQQLFEWPLDGVDPALDYGWIPAPPGGIGGGIGRSQDGGPGHVTFYVEVDDPAASLEAAQRLGGKTVMPPTDIAGYGLTLAFLADPEGHIIGLSKGALQGARA